ncbi:hypothetical protein IID21_03320 [Patescibacteria group bacterium]|nr:hypothetical protein [Patescibacteria group bacterium]
MVGTSEQVGGPGSNFDRLRDLLNYQPNNSESEVVLNEDERILATRHWEEGLEGVLCQLIKDDDIEINFWLMSEDRLSAVGLKGLAVKLGNSWIKVREYVVINGKDLGEPEETRMIADYMVDLVAKAISERRIPEVEIPLKLAPRDPR